MMYYQNGPKTGPERASHSEVLSLVYNARSAGSVDRSIGTLVFGYESRSNRILRKNPYHGLWQGRLTS